MRKANLADVPEMEWRSPGGKFGGFGKILTDAIGGDCRSNDPGRRHPFEVEITRLPPGRANCPYHFHTVQWEFYIIISGEASVREEAGDAKAGAGDFFAFGPGEAHQITNASATEDLSFYVLADNPAGDHCYYPDSDKWLVGQIGKRKIIQGREVEYLDGEGDPDPEASLPT